MVQFCGVFKCGGSQLGSFIHLNGIDKRKSRDIHTSRNLVGMGWKCESEPGSGLAPFTDPPRYNQDTNLVISAMINTTCATTAIQVAQRSSSI